MEKEAPSLESLLLGIGIFPYNISYRTLKRSIEIYIEMADQSVSWKKKPCLKSIYQLVAQESGTTYKTIMYYVRELIGDAYEKTKLKFMFNYLGVTVDPEYKPTVTEFFYMVGMIERDYRRQHPEG